MLLSRSKSTGCLDVVGREFDFKCFRRFCGYSGYDNRHASVSSIDGCFECTGSDLSAEDHKLDSGIGKSLLDGGPLFVLEQKVDKLNELLEEQQKLLKSIKEEVKSTKVLNYHFSASDIPTENNSEKESKQETCNDRTESTEETSAQSLLNALDTKQDSRSLDQMIETALENFLQSDALKEQVAAVTAQSVKGVVKGSLCRALSGAYLPLVERSHRRLIKHVTKLLGDSFMELEEGSASFFRSIHSASRNIRTSLERHQTLLKTTDPDKNINSLRTALKEVLEDELKAWRGLLVNELSQRPTDDSQESECSPESPYIDCPPLSPAQPANPDMSIIDSLMKCALINKHIQEGDVNGAFEEALSSSDLSLVMAACRAASPGALLRPAVLLSLLQQLATDMVHDTQLKCRYLEEAIIRLDKCDAATRAHLPLVVGEVRKHLTKFLLAYPKHHASRRVALIVMASDNLLK